MKKNAVVAAVIVALLVLLAIVFQPFKQNQPNQSLPKFKLAGSIYVGWMPWFLASEDGTLKKVGKTHGVDIEFVRGDYIETINQFAAGGVDAVVLTNIDAVALLVGSGVKTDVVLIGSYSHGNDAIMLPKSSQDTNLTSKRLGLVEYSVSHYLLDRYLEKQNIPQDAVKKLNVSDSEIAAAFAAGGSDLDGVVTWNPIVLQIEDQLNGKRLADSKIIEKEIADMLVVRRSVVESNPQFVQALLDTWFTMTARMNASDKAAVYEQLGKLSGGSGVQYQAQLETTLLVDSPEQALAFIQEDGLKSTMTSVKRFVDRYQLVEGNVQQQWVGYSAQSDAIIRFNEQPLQSYTKGK